MVRDENERMGLVGIIRRESTVLYSMRGKDGERSGAGRETSMYWIWERNVSQDMVRYWMGRDGTVLDGH